MTSPSSPRAGRSTVSAAGEPRTDLTRFRTPSAKALMEWADLARRGPDVLTLRRTLVATLPRIEAEAAESRPSVTEALRIPQSSPDYATRYGRGWNDALAAVDRVASPAGPEAVPQSEREGLRAALERIANAERSVSECPTPGRCMYPQHHADDEDRAAFSDRLQRIARAALASPAHPDEE